jgi:hypothetical protein
MSIFYALFPADLEGQILIAFNEECRDKNPMENVEFAEQGLLLNQSKPKNLITWKMVKGNAR